MPLRAYIEDKEIVSIDLNDEEWSALKARLKAKEIVLTLPCCGQEGFLRAGMECHPRIFRSGLEGGCFGCTGRQEDRFRGSMEPADL